MIARDPTSTRTTIRIRLDGCIDPRAVEGFRRGLESIAADASNVTIDASGLRYLYSDGLGVLVDVSNQLRRKGGCLRLVEPPGWLTRLLGQTQLDELISVEDRRGS